METISLFDLNRAIQDWRESLAQSPAFRREDLAELEAHLRDSVVALQGHGLSAEEAFIVASRRVGKEGVLESEFAKVNTPAVWLDRALWMLIGIQFWAFVSGVITSTTRSAVSFGLISYEFTTYGHVIPAMLYVFAYLLGFTASLVICWWLIFRRGSSLGEWAASRLRRHRLSYLTFIASCGLALFALVMNFGMSYGITILQLKFTDLNKFAEIARSQQYSWIASYVVQTVTLLTLTLMLARNRLHTCEA